MPDPVELSKDPVVIRGWVDVVDPDDVTTANVCITTRAYNGFTPVDVTVCANPPSELLPVGFFETTMATLVGDEYATLLLVPSEGWFLNKLQVNTNEVTPDDNPTYFTAP